MAGAFLRAPLASGLAFAVRRDQSLAEQLLEARPLTVCRVVREAWRAGLSISEARQERAGDTGLAPTQC